MNKNRVLFMIDEFTQRFDKYRYLASSRWSMYNLSCNLINNSDIIVCRTEPSRINSILHRLKCHQPMNIKDKRFAERIFLVLYKILNSSIVIQNHLL